MITRVQAEALLTLAESLEACERLGVDLGVGVDGETWIGVSRDYKDDFDVPGFSASTIRDAVKALTPAQEQS